MKSAIVFIVFILIVIGLLFTLSRKKFPLIPDDSFHRGIRDAAVCMECHGPGKRYEMKKTHPPKFACFKCHERKGG
ncbi:MAG: hypothetical protein P8Z71_06915 [Candidatus Sulfobium sp.]